MKIWLLFLALLMPVTASAAPNPDFIEIKAGTPVSLKPDRAYILFRSVKGKGVMVAEPVFLREQSRKDDSLNLARTHNGNRFAQGQDEDTFLVEVLPGSYVIAGVANKAAPQTLTCMCMGTVRFEAKAGVITDLGHFVTDRVDQVSTIPDLRAVSGRGARINGMLLLVVATVRPDAATASVPTALQGMPRVPADFRAVGRFPNRFALSVNRMAAIPGILEYDEDRVIDVKGSIAP